MRKVVLLLALIAGSAQAVAAKPAIRDVPELDNGLFTVGMANEIRKKCPEISGRLVKGLGELRKLRVRANQLGYSDTEIEAHMKSDVEKDRMRALAKAYMKSRGLAQNTEGYCALGHMELEQKSGVGALLRATN